MKSLKQRVLEDKAFITHSLMKLPIDKVLATVQAKYPEAHYYAPYNGFLFFREKENDWGLCIELDENYKQVLVTWDLEKRIDDNLTEIY